ncbi:unnamed protein product [Amoebophrya sp. A120]|nr:unnamed protein product [Amoebophrya sp. A120]|eukprot:GSA120T00008163001.1
MTSSKSELFDYLRMAEQQLRVMDSDTRIPFLRTVVQELKNHELDCVTQQRCSRIIEYLLKQITELDTFRPLFLCLLGKSASSIGTSGSTSTAARAGTAGATGAGEVEHADGEERQAGRVFQILAQNQYGSHVLETLFAVAAEKGFLFDRAIMAAVDTLVAELLESGEDAEAEQEEILQQDQETALQSQQPPGQETDVPKMLQPATKTTKKNSVFLQIAADRSGTHVIRSLLLMLSGFVVPVEKNKKGKKAGTGYGSYENYSNKNGTSTSTTSSGSGGGDHINGFNSNSNPYLPLKRVDVEKLLQRFTDSALTFVAAGDQQNAEDTGADELRTSGINQRRKDEEGETALSATPITTSFPPLLTQSPFYFGLFFKLLQQLVAELRHKNSTSSSSSATFSKASYSSSPLSDARLGPVIGTAVSIAADAASCVDEDNFFCEALRKNQQHKKLRQLLQQLCQVIIAEKGEELLNCPVGSRILEACFSAHKAGVRVVQTFVKEVLLKESKGEKDEPDHAEEGASEKDRTTFFEQLVRDGKRKTSAGIKFSNSNPYVLLVIQRLLDVLGHNKQTNSKDAHLLELLLQKTNFAEWLAVGRGREKNNSNLNNNSAKYQMVAAKLLQCCVRVNAHFKTAAGKFCKACFDIATDVGQEIAGTTRSGSELPRGTRSATDIINDANKTTSSCSTSSSSKMKRTTKKHVSKEQAGGPPPDGANNSSVWLQILYLGAVPALSKKNTCKKQAASSADSAAAPEAAERAAVDVAVVDDPYQPPTYTSDPPAAGIVALTALLSFPDKCVPFLTAEKEIKLLAAAVFPLAMKAPRMVEEILKTPLLNGSMKTKLIGGLLEEGNGTTSTRASRGAASSHSQPQSFPTKIIPLVHLALQRRTGWVATAAWKNAPSAKQKEQIATILVKFEKELREQNIAVWKGCELHAWKTRHVEWKTKHEMQDKKKQVFADILDRDIVVAGSSARGGRGASGAGEKLKKKIMAKVDKKGNHADSKTPVAKTSVGEKKKTMKKSGKIKTQKDLLAGAEHAATEQAVPAAVVAAHEISVSKTDRSSATAGTATPASGETENKNSSNKRRSAGNSKNSGPSAGERNKSDVEQTKDNSTAASTGVATASVDDSLAKVLAFLQPGGTGSSGAASGKNGKAKKQRKEL